MSIVKNRIKDKIKKVLEGPITVPGVFSIWLPNLDFLINYWLTFNSN